MSFKTSKHLSASRKEKYLISNEGIFDVVNCKDIPIRHKICLIIIKLKPVMRTVTTFTSL